MDGQTLLPNSQATAVSRKAGGLTWWFNYLVPLLVCLTLHPHLKGSLNLLATFTQFEKWGEISNFCEVWWLSQWHPGTASKCCAWSCILRAIWALQGPVRSKYKVQGFNFATGNKEFWYMFKLTKSLVELQQKEKLQHHHTFGIGSASHFSATACCFWGQRTKTTLFSLKDILYSIFFIYNIIF